MRSCARTLFALIALVTVVSSVATPAWRITHAITNNCKDAVDSLRPCTLTSTAAAGSTDTAVVRLVWYGGEKDAYTASCTPSGAITACSMSPSGGSLPANNTTAPIDIIYTMSATANVGATGTATFFIGSCCDLTGTLTATLSTPVSVAPVNGGSQDVAAYKTDTTSFTVKSLGLAGTYNLTPSCTWGGSSLSCTATQSSVTLASGGSATIGVVYQAGAPTGAGVINLTAKSTTNSTYTATGTASVTSTWLSYLSINTSYTNQEDQEMSRCGVKCFAVTASVSTPAYTSEDGPRAITLEYNSDRATVRPILMADVSFAANAYPLSEVQLTSQLYIATSSSWTTVNFFNSDANHILHFAASPFGGATIPYRVAGQFDASGYQVNVPGNAVYPMRIIVTAVYQNGHSEAVTDSSHHLMLMNTRQSYIANGWLIAGVSQHNWGIGSSPDQSWIMQADGDGSASIYGPVNNCSPACVWPSPAGSHISDYWLCCGPVYYPDSSRDVYNPAGDLTMRIGRLGDTVVYSYDGQRRDTAISDPYRLRPGGSAHAYWKINYGTHGIASIVEPGPDGTPSKGRTSSIAIDSATGELRTWTDPDGKATTFGYDAQQRLVSITDRNGNLTRYAYDPNTWKIDSIVSPPVHIDKNGTGGDTLMSLVTTYQAWQAAGLPTSATSLSNPAQPARTDTIRARVANEVGKVSSFTVDRWGQAKMSVDVLGDTTSYVRDGNGFATTITYPSGAQDLFTYNGTSLTLNQPAGAISTNYHYGTRAQVDSTWGTGQPTVYYYPNASAHGRLDSSIVAVSRAKIAYTYDAFTRVTQVVDAMGDTTQYAYDAPTGNRNSTASMPSNRYTKKVFDRYGRDSLVRSAGLPYTAAVYDSLNRVIQGYDGVHATPVMIKFDGLYQDTVIDATGTQKYSSTHNALGWPMTLTDPAGDTSSTTYYPTGLVATSKNRRGQRIAYQYDSANRIVAVHRPLVVSGELDTLETTKYLNKGTVVIAQNGYATDTTYISTAGWPDSVVTWLTAANKRFKRYYHHNKIGQVDSIKISTTASGIDFFTRHFIYDSISTVLRSIKLDTTSAVQLGYTADLLRDSTTFLGSGALRSDAISDIHTVLQTEYSTAPLNGQFSGNFAYDSSGRLTESDYPTGQGIESELLSYDGAGDLIGRQLGFWNQQYNCQPGGGYDGYPCPNQNEFQTSQDTMFVYDAAFNLDTLRSFKNDTVFLTAKYNKGNRDTTFGSRTFANDLDGDRTAVSGAQSASYTFGADGRLLSVTSGSTTYAYDYDAHGQLVHRHKNGQSDRYYLWDAGQLIAELDSLGNNRVAEYAYYPGVTDAPLALITGAVGARVIHYYHQDVMGNVLGTFSSTGQVEQTLQYDPWGQVEQASSTLSDTTRLRWKGLLWQGDIVNLYYVRARWYDPVSRRFISEDPLGAAGGSNQYAFAGNDPINGSDPSGACTPECILTLFGDGIYGWDLDESCIGCDGWGADPAAYWNSRAYALSVAYGTNVPADMMDYNPQPTSASCDPGAVGGATCVAEAISLLGGDAVPSDGWSGTDIQPAGPPAIGFSIGLPIAVFWSRDTTLFDCANGRLNGTVFGTMDGFGAEFEYDMRSTGMDARTRYYGGTVLVKIPDQVNTKYYIDGRILCSVQGRFRWYAAEDPWASP